METDNSELITETFKVRDECSSFVSNYKHIRTYFHTIYCHEIGDVFSVTIASINNTFH